MIYFSDLFRRKNLNNFSKKDQDLLKDLENYYKDMYLSEKERKKKPERLISTSIARSLPRYDLLYHVKNALENRDDKSYNEVKLYLTSYHQLKQPDHTATALAE